MKRPRERPTEAMCPLRDSCATPSSGLRASLIRCRGAPSDGRGCGGAWVRWRAQRGPPGSAGARVALGARISGHRRSAGGARRHPRAGLDVGLPPGIRRCTWRTSEHIRTLSLTFPPESQLGYLDTRDIEESTGMAPVTSEICAGRSQRPEVGAGPALPAPALRGPSDSPQAPDRDHSTSSQGARLRPDRRDARVDGNAGAGLHRGRASTGRTGGGTMPPWLRHRTGSRPTRFRSAGLGLPKAIGALPGPRSSSGEVRAPRRGYG